MKPLRLLVLILTALLALATHSLARADEPGRKESPAPSPRESAEPRETTPPGGGGNGGSGGSGGSGSTGPAGVSVPRVMLESVTSTPRIVPAGTSFTLTYSLVNQSKKSRVNNLKVTLSQGDGAFLPANGSSSTFISTIKPGGSISRDMTFSTLPSLENRPYAITMTIEYEDGEANAYSTSETISIAVAQPTRADTSSFTLTPAELSVGDETTVAFSLNNLGKSKIFNARITVAEGQGVAPKEQFIGSVDAGAAANVEMLLTATDERMEPVTAVITFEDSDGAVVTLEKQLALTVAPPIIQEGPMPGIGMEEPTDKPAEGGDAWLWWVIGGVGLGLALLVVSIVLSRRAKRRREQSSDLDLLDGSPLVDSDL